MAMFLKVMWLSVAFCAVTLAAEQWNLLAPTGTLIPARSNHGLAYDASTNRLIVFGGVVSAGPVEANDVWVLTNANGLGGVPQWTQLAPSGLPPSARADSATAYDATANRLIVFGGRSGASQNNDTWVLTNANGLGGAPQWTQLSPTGTPPSVRAGHTAVYDLSGNRLIVFGGCSAANAFFCFNFLNDIWVLSNANGVAGTPSWQQLSPSGGAPAGRFSHMAAYDPNTNRMIVTGGAINGQTFTDTWVLTNANGVGGLPQWILLSPTNATLMGYNAAAAYDSVTHSLFIGPGVDLNGTSSDTWRLDNADGVSQPNWVKLSPIGGLPPMQNALQMAGGLDSIDQRFIIFGGLDSAGSLLNQTWVLNLHFSPLSACLLYDSTKAHKAGSTIPIKLQICNSSGENLSASSTLLHAVSVLLASTTITGPVEDSGNANPDDDFRYDPTLGGTGGYIFNISTKDLASGTYNLMFSVNGSTTLLAASFQVK